MGISSIAPLLSWLPVSPAFTKLPICKHVPLTGTLERHARETKAFESWHFKNKSISQWWGWNRSYLLWNRICMRIGPVGLKKPSFLPFSAGTVIYSAPQTSLSSFAVSSSFCLFLHPWIELRGLSKHAAPSCPVGDPSLHPCAVGTQCHKTPQAPGR